MKNLLKAFTWAIAAILIVLMYLGICSCNSVKKTSSTLKENIDSTVVSKNEIVESSAVDTTKSNSIDTSTTTINEDGIEITFNDGYEQSGNLHPYKNGYTFNGDTTLKEPLSWSAFQNDDNFRTKDNKYHVYVEHKPIVITKEKGKTTIDPGGRNVKSITDKSKETVVQNNKIDAKELGVITNNSVQNTFDSATYKKELEAKNTTKDKSFDWFTFFCWLIPILAVLYFTAKYLYNKKKLPLSLWLAKALLFV